MSLDTKLSLSEFQIVGKLPDNLVQTPTFLEGPFGQAVCERYQELRESVFHNNHNLRLEYENGIVTNSTPLDSILLDQIVREVQGSPRTPLPRDFADQRILDMVKGKHYSDTRAFVLRNPKDSYNSRN